MRIDTRKTILSLAIVLSSGCGEHNPRIPGSSDDAYLQSLRRWRDKVTACFSNTGCGSRIEKDRPREGEVTPPPANTTGSAPQPEGEVSYPAFSQLTKQEALFLSRVWRAFESETPLITYARHVSCFCPGPHTRFVRVEFGRVTLVTVPEANRDTGALGATEIAVRESNSETDSLLISSAFASVAESLGRDQTGVFTIETLSGKDAGFVLSADPIPQAVDDEYSLRFSAFRFHEKL